MRILLSFIFAVMGLVTTSAQFHEPVRFTASQKQIKPGVLEVSFTGKIDEGWHVYGTDIEDGGPTRAELTIESSAGLKPGGSLQTVGDVHYIMDPIFGIRVSTIEGSVTFRQLFNITSDSYSLKGYLTFGACNDANCLPPTDVEFDFEGSNEASGAKAAEETAAAAPADTVISPDSTLTEAAETARPKVQPKEEKSTSYWEPVIDKLAAMSADDSGSSIPRSASIITIFLLGMAGGLLALLTPCVWPIIPMTVSFFLKRSKDDRRKGIGDAFTYGISIIVIYVGLGMLVTLLFGSSALNSMSTNAVFNIFFFLMLLVFGMSFLGGFEITLPSSWTNAVNGKADRTSGLLSIFLMAFTLSLVSFSCTGPIIGFLLVEVGTTGSRLAPAVGMLGFALALALPFTLFALFPTWLKKAPRSGNWMNCIKVCLGFLEIAFSLKFLSVADLAYKWHILDREVFICLWVVIFMLMGCYLLGWIRLPHDEDEYDDEGNIVVRPRTSITRLFCGAGILAFALYMIPGLWGAPCKAISAFAPPRNTQDFNLGGAEVRPRFEDFEMGMQYAKANNMPVMIDFTGYGCVNCRKMEAAVWTNQEIAETINERFVLITLHVDDKTPLAEPVTVTENSRSRTLRTVGDKWSYLQRCKFGANAQPFYVLIDADGMPLAPSYGYKENIQAYLDWLQLGLRNSAKAE